MPHELGMFAGEEERYVRAVADSDDIGGTQAERHDDRGRVVGHHLVGKFPRAVGAVSMAALVDADDCAVGHEIVALLRERVVEEGHAAVQEHDRRAVSEALDVELRAAHLEESPRGGRLVRAAADRDEQQAGRAGNVRQ